jgi:glyoxylase-like metal-dependent hydrolase (beta-lactamase superfamily II)
MLMLEKTNFQDVTVFKMGRSIGKYVLYSVHSFLLEDTLIDTGTKFASDEFLSTIIDGGKKTHGGEFLLEFKERQVNKIINTHYHEDHTGNNHLLQQIYLSEIFAHPDSLPYIIKPDNLKLKPYQKIVWGYPESSKAKAVEKSIHIGRYQFLIIPCEGHSAGHICLYEPQEKWLFTGDMFCGVKNIYLRQDEDFNLMLKSLHNLSQLNIETLFCSLKGVVNNGSQALADKVEYMNNLRDETFRLHKAGRRPVQIRDKLLGREGFMFYLTGGHFAKINLIKSILTQFYKNN